MAVSWKNGCQPEHILNKIESIRRVDLSLLRRGLQPANDLTRLRHGVLAAPLTSTVCHFLGNFSRCQVRQGQFPGKFGGKGDNEFE
ncbi:MAG: hypothetical protein R3D55_00525 [Chloroflexota bacterium]